MLSMSEYVAGRIKELRFTHRRTQQEVADFIGVSRQAYARYESGQREPSLEIIERMCDFFGVSPMLFFRNGPERRAPKNTCNYQQNRQNTSIFSAI
jgi:transcriptional regulator with XRE-family HTH domain